MCDAIPKSIVCNTSIMICSSRIPVTCAKSTGAGTPGRVARKCAMYSWCPHKVPRHPASSLKSVHFNSFIILDALQQKHMHTPLFHWGNWKHSL